MIDFAQAVALDGDQRARAEGELGGVDGPLHGAAIGGIDPGGGQSLAELGGLIAAFIG
jgi:hypothetical protein